MENIHEAAMQIERGAAGRVNLSDEQIAYFAGIGAEWGTLPAPEPCECGATIPAGVAMVVPIGGGWMPACDACVAGTKPEEA